MKKYKFLIIIFLISSVGFYVVVGAFNYIIDPFGFRGLEGKTYRNLSFVEPMFAYPIRINQKAQLYVLGNSFMRAYDLPKMQNYSKKRVSKVSKNSQRLIETLFLIEKIKENNGNFIYGFDPITLNKSNQNYRNRLYDTFQKDKLENAFTFLFHFTSSKASVEQLKYKMLSIEANNYFKNIDNTIYAENSFSAIEQRLIKNKPFVNYMVEFDKVLHLAKIADENDIFVFQPTYFYAFYMNSKFGAEQQYFQAVELLVKNTKARVVSFYGINDISINVNNFDDGGGHFKPRIGDLILARIFGDSETLEKYEKENNVDLSNFGVELNSENIDEYLKSVKYDFEKYKPYLEKALYEPQNAHINKDKFLNQTKSF